MSNLKDYVMQIPALSEGVCQSVVSELEKQKWTEHTFSDYDGTKVYKPYRETCETILNGTSIDSLVMDSLYEPIANYVRHIGKHYFKSWSGYTPVKYNKYRTGKSMEKHIDHIYDIFDNDIGIPKGIPTLSIIGVLNNDYSGGAIEMFEDTKYNLKAGELLIFPSIFLYPHKVCEVTRGTRYSFVSWVY